MRKGFLICLAMVIVAVLVVPALAGDYIFVDETPQLSLGPNVYMANIKVKRGPFGGGFFGTDAGWILYEKNPATLEKKIIASGNGRFDGTTIAAAAAAGGALGGMNALAASMIRPARVSGGNASASASQSQSQNQAQAQAQSQYQNQSNFNFNVNKGGWIPPGHDK